MKKFPGVYTHSMETIYLPLSAQVAVGTFFRKSPEGNKEIKTNQTIYWFTVNFASLGPLDSVLACHYLVFWLLRQGPQKNHLCFQFHLFSRNSAYVTLYSIYIEWKMAEISGKMSISHVWTHNTFTITLHEHTLSGALLFTSVYWTADIHISLWYISFERACH